MLEMFQTHKIGKPVWRKQDLASNIRKKAKRVFQTNALTYETTDRGDQTFAFNPLQDGERPLNT
jgi:hypothetical protein